MRQSILSALGACEGWFLRIHRDADALYVTDFPSRKGEKAADGQRNLEKAGFTVRPCGKNGDLWALDMTEESWLRFLSLAAGAPHDGIRHAGFASLENLFIRHEEENIPMARALLKWSVQNGRSPDDDFRRFSGMYALALRRHELRPGKGCAGLIRQGAKRMGL